MIPSGAEAHFIGVDSVDGGEIRYDDQTDWDDSLDWAIDAWNALGEIDILADTWSTVADVQVYDYNADDGLCSFYINSPGSDEIELNDNSYLDLDLNQRRACTTHEFGHALGLGHSYTTQVMDPCASCHNPIHYTTPQSHDESDYYELWDRATNDAISKV